jgi:hypothetical protein
MPSAGPTTVDFPVASRNIRDTGTGPCATPENQSTLGIVGRKRLIEFPIEIGAYSDQHGARLVGQVCAERSRKSQALKSSPAMPVSALKQTSFTDFSSPGRLHLSHIN